MNFELRFDSDRPYECGARLLTTVACARSFDDAKFEAVFCSTCAKALWLTHQLCPDDETPITVNPRHVFRDPKTIDRDFSFLGKRIQERLVAGRMAVAFLQRIVLGEAARLPGSVKRLSLNQLAELVLDDAGQNDPVNVEKRVWKPSRSVIHLCAAMAVIGQQFKRAGTQVGLESFLFVPDLTERVARLAEEYAAHIETDPNFPVRPEELIRLRPV